MRIIASSEENESSMKAPSATSGSFDMLVAIYQECGNPPIKDQNGFVAQSGMAIRLSTDPLVHRHSSFDD